MQDNTRLTKEAESVLSIIQSELANGGIYQGINNAVAIVTDGLIKNHPNWRTYNDYVQWSAQLAEKHPAKLAPIKVFCLALEQVAMSDPWRSALAGDYTLQGKNSVFRVSFYNGFNNAMKMKLAPAVAPDNPFTQVSPKQTKNTGKIAGKALKTGLSFPFKVIGFIANLMGEALWACVQVFAAILKVLWLIGTILCIIDLIHRWYIAMTISEAIKNL